MSRRTLLVWATALVASVSAVLALMAVHYRSARAADRRFVRIVFEDEAVRVKTVKQNLAFATEVNDESLLVKARAFRRLLALEPEMLASAEGRFDECRRLLGLDELHVSDAQGKLVCSIPKSSLGFSLGSVPQSAAFLPAVTNRAFEYVQLPIVKVTDGRAMQYAGVSRPDSPGVIQVGQRAEFINELRRMTSSSFLSPVTRVGKTGRMTLVPARGTPLPKPEMRTERIDGRLTYVYEGDADGLRIRIEMPVAGPVILPPGIGWAFGALSAVAFAFLFVLLRGGMGLPQAASRQKTVRPVTALLFILFLCASSLSWVMESASARHSAEACLAWSVKDALTAEDEFWRWIDDERWDARGRLDSVEDRSIADRYYALFALGWHVWHGGYFLCYHRKTGDIISCGSPKWKVGDTVTSAGFNVEKDTGSGTQVFSTTLFGEECLCAAEHLDHGDCRVVAVLPQRVVDWERDRASAFTITVLAVVFLFLAGFMNRLSRVAGSLREYIEADKAKRAKDLALARTIRRSVMPTDFPKSPRFELSASLAEDGEEELGGAFYDFFRLPSGHLLMLVGRANATGISAALEMMKTKAFVKSLAAQSESLVEIVSRVNAEMCRVNEAKVTVAALFATYDEETGVVVAVDAGSPGAPFAVPASPALGASAKSRYAAGRTVLAPGGVLELGGILRLVRALTETASK